MLSQNLFFTKMAEVSMLPLLLYSLIAIVFIIIFYLLIKNFLTRRKLEEAKRDASKEIPSPAEHLGRRRTRVHLRGSQLNSCVLSTDKIIPRSVNYHFTRQCNYKCGFCFHTAKNSFVLPIEDAKRGLKMLKEAGMEKINFSGGEPFIHKRGEFVGELTRYCKKDLEMQSVSVVCNGSLVTERWFSKYGEFLDIMAVSCDSFDEEKNRQIGRHQSGKGNLKCLQNIRDWCKKYRVAFKINTVVNTFNFDEDMTERIKELAPVRWKVFQCLLIEGENCGTDALRQAQKFVISDDQFNRFVERHSKLPCLVPESNEKMQNSYLILDEWMRFLDCRSGAKTPSKSLLDVGVEDAINASGFDEEMFLRRGGKYTWSKADMNLEW